MPLRSVNPATGELLRTVDSLTEERLLGKISIAAEAAKVQRATALEHRVQALRKLAALLEEEREEIARSITVETGKPVRAARNEVEECVVACRAYADHGPRLLMPELLGDHSGTYVQRVPLGLMLALLPGHSPVRQAVSCAVPALLAGNAILLKLAESVPGTALLLETLVRRAGYPQGAVTALLLDEHLVETAFHDGRVAGVFVAGSETAARALAAQAGWLLKKAMVRSTGSESLIIMPSGDVPAAVAAATHVISTAECSAKRVIVHTAVYDQVAGLLIQALEALRVGDPMRDDTDLGPLGTSRAVERLEDQILAAVKAGGRILTGGTRLIGSGNFFEPTLLGDVPADSPVARDALAGPVALLFRAGGVQEAIAMANSEPPCNDAAVWTREPAEEQQLIGGIAARSIALNAGFLAGTLPIRDQLPGLRHLELHRLREWTSEKIVCLA